MLIKRSHREKKTFNPAHGKVTGKVDFPYSLLPHSFISLYSKCIKDTSIILSLGEYFKAPWIQFHILILLFCHIRDLFFLFTAVYFDYILCICDIFFSRNEPNFLGRIEAGVVWHTFLEHLWIFWLLPYWKSKKVTAKYAKICHEIYETIKYFWPNSQTTRPSQTPKKQSKSH